MTSYPYHLSITSSISTDYEVMQRGFTDAVCILGFADCDSEYLNKAYRVDSITDAVDVFTGSTLYDSTLIKGMLECYKGGCRDIYLYPVATMANYIAPADRTSGFYTSLYTYYDNALDIIKEVDDIDIIVPYDIDLDENANFAAQFADHCSSINGSSLRLAFIPYNGIATTTFEGETYNLAYINGTGAFHFPDFFGSDYTSNMAASFAGMYSNLSPNVPPDNRDIKVPIMFDSDYEDDEETLEANAIVGFRKTVRYKRVYDSSLSTTLCYTRGSANSDFRRLYTVHVIQRLLRAIEALDLIGSAAYLAQDSLEDFFRDWVDKGYAQNIEATYRLTNYTLYVNLTLYLPYPIGEVILTMSIGPFV